MEISLRLNRFALNHMDDDDTHPTPMSSILHEFECRQAQKCFEFVVT